MELFFFTWHVSFFFITFNAVQIKMHFKTQLTINKHVFKICTKLGSKTARYVWRLYTKKLNLFSFQKVKIYTFVCIDCIHACTLVNVFTSFSRPAQKTVIILHKTASVDSYSIIHIQTKTLTFVRWTTLTPLCTNSVRSKQSITIHN